MEHDLKIWPSSFRAVQRRDKNFEVRKDDRDYKVGDFLLLREWDPKTGEYTGAATVRLVIYKMEGGMHGVELGYCILGLQ